MTKSSPRRLEIVAVSLDRLGIIVPVACLVTGAGIVAVHQQAKAWQLLAAVVLLLINALAFLLARLLARRGLEGEGGALMVVTVWVSFAGAALLSTGVGLALGATEALAGILLATMVLTPRQRPWFWLGSVAGGIAIWASGWLAVPWPRFDVNASPATWLGVRLLLGSVIVVLTVLAIRAHRRSTLLPTRLTVLAVAVVLVTAAAMHGVSTLLETLDARDRVYAHLETDIVLKREAIASWGNRLNRVLDDLASFDSDMFDILDSSPAGKVAQLDREGAGALRDKFHLALRYAQAFTEVALVDARGIILVSTDPAREGTLVAGEGGLPENATRPATASAAYVTGVRGGVLTFARPLVRDGETLGALIAWADLAAPQQIARSGPEGTRIRTYLVGPDYALLTEEPWSGSVVPVHSEAIDSVLEERLSVPGRASYTSHTGVPVLGAYVWDPDLQVGIVSETPTGEALAVGKAAPLTHAGVTLLAALLAGAMAYAVAQDIVQPLSMLSDSLLSIADGDLNQVVEVACDDEVGALAESLNVMSAQIQDVVGGLNRRLRVQMRALRTVEETSQLVCSGLDEGELLGRIVDLIQERFALAYVGIFLLDEDSRYAVLHTGTGEVGATMLASGWRLLCGGASMIGQCVATGESLVSQRLGDTVVRLENPLLPDVRSEAAFPITLGAQVLGAMTVQSLQRGAYSDADLVAFQALADLVALALQPVPSDGKGQEVRDTQAVTLVPEAAGDTDRAGETVSDELLGSGANTSDSVPLPGAPDGLGQQSAVDGDMLRLPLLQGDAVVGVLHVERPGGWPPDAIAMAMALAKEMESVVSARSHPRTAHGTVKASCDS
ncbi:MAG: GAF domain-containing protein [Anaerolineae bacterium]|nr:GAF domain-containing protein [Anaerolineae bacterium]